jgi:uncharacterized protein (DUF2147 family)
MADHLAITVSRRIKPASPHRFAIRLALCLALAMAPAVAAAETVFGKWLTDDGAAVIAIERCGQHLCGRIARVLDPRAPANDINDPDRRKQSQPLVGTIVLSGFDRAGSEWEGGEAYDPKTGRTYRSRLKLLDGGKLEVTGCVLFLCRSRYWTRAG